MANKFQPLVVDDPSYVEKLVEQAIPQDENVFATGVELPNSKKPGHSGVFRNKFAVDGLKDSLHPTLTTFYETFSFAVANYPDKKCLGRRETNEDGSLTDYKYLTYREVDTKKKNFGSGVLYVLQNSPFKTHSISHQKIDSHFDSLDDSFVLTIFSSNRREWSITDLACVNYSILNTALYDTLGATTSQYILSLTQSPIVVCSKDKLKQLIDLKAKRPNELSNLICLVSMDPLDIQNQASGDFETVELARKHQIQLFDFDQVEKLGELARIPDFPPAPETHYTISFTSGTTGANPKGVLLTHRNGVASTVFCRCKNAGLPDGSTYSFLPLAHIYERMMLNYSLTRGIAIGYPSTPQPTSLMGDVLVLNPLALNLVPRVLTKMESSLKAQTVNNEEKPILRYLFRKAVEYKIKAQAVEDGAKGNHIFHDRIINLLRKKLGFSKTFTLTTGSAPISPDTIKFLKAILGVGVCQGYGLTESFAGICSSAYYEANPGSCGPPGVTAEVRLREIPEMNYTADDEGGPRGELLLRGPQIFKEYYKDPKETEKAFDEEGWFKTGDVARIDSETGKIYIVDRVKNFFKLSQGEYITPEKIENTLLSCFPVAQQIYVHGDSLHSFLVGIVGIEPLSARPWVKNVLKVAPPQDDAQLLELLNEPEHKRVFLNQMNGSAAQLLQGLEKIHNVKIAIEPLKVDDDTITPTMKIKRPIAKRFFNDVFEDLYKEGSLLNAGKL